MPWSFTAGLLSKHIIGQLNIEQAMGVSTQFLKGSDSILGFAAGLVVSTLTLKL